MTTPGRAYMQSTVAARSQEGSLLRCESVIAMLDPPDQDSNFSQGRNSNPNLLQIVFQLVVGTLVISNSMDL